MSGPIAASDVWEEQLIAKYKIRRSHCHWFFKVLGAVASLPSKDFRHARSVFELKSAETTIRILGSRPK